MTGWRLADVAVLRHAGFPFDWLEDLGLPEAAVRALDALLDAESALLGTAGHRSGAVREAIASGRGPAAPQPEPAGWKGALRRWEDARARAEAGTAAAMPALRARLRDRARDARVREAVFLSNPDMYVNVWERYAGDRQLVDNARWRRVERQVYNYLQRFCAKNETTSFFGPMGYAEAVAGGGLSVTYRADPPRRTFFAVWAVRALAAAIEGEPAVAADLPLRPNPLYDLDGAVLHCDALGVEQQLPAAAAALLRAAREAGTVRAAARAAGLDLAVAGRAARTLARLGAVTVGLVLDEHRAEVFDQLAAAVGSLPPSPARDRWSRCLEELAQARARFARGDLAERRSALTAAEEAFTRATGAPARRGAGRIYADRLVLYEEAASPFVVAIGERVLADLARRLSGALEVSAAYGERFGRMVAASVATGLAQDTPRGRTSLLRYSLAAAERHGERQASLPPVRLPPAAGEAVSVEETICGSASPGPRYALPDVCLAAASTGALASGAAQVVLARVHHHLLVDGWLATFCPDRARFERVAAGWLERSGLRERLLAPVFRRRNKGFYRYPGLQITFTDPPAGEDMVPATALEVSFDGDGAPVLRDGAGRRAWLYLPLADFVTYPPYAALSHPPVLHAPLQARAGDDQALPRVTVGGAVYQRRRWRIDCASLQGPGGFDLLMAAHRLRRHHGLPRFAFARVASERKPFLVDFTSPFAAALLRHMARDEPAVRFEEMLPGPDDLWLRDEQGRRYTCELRMQAERGVRDGG